MKRKVIKQGINTLTMTLPKRWVERCSIKPSDEIEVNEDGNALIVSATCGKPKPDSISVDISGLERTSVVILMQGLYRFGYDDIDITTSDTLIPHYRKGKMTSVQKVVHEVVHRFIGSEIVSATAKHISVKKISDESIDQFDSLLRQLFRLVNHMMSVFLEAAEKRDLHMLESIEQHHSNVKRFVNYCLRLLNKCTMADTRRTTFLFSIIQYMSKIDDFIKNAARHILRYNLWISDKAVKVVRDIELSLTLYQEMYYDYSLDRLRNLNEQRDKVWHNFFKAKTYQKEDIVIIVELLQIVEILLDMTELRMAMEH